MNKTYQFTVTYFTASGKFSTRATFSRSVRDSDGTPAMNDAAAHLRGLRDADGQDALYGIRGSGWNGYMVVDCPDGYPILILPRDDSA